jgi:hypothetical protein
MSQGGKFSLNRRENQSWLRGEIAGAIVDLKTRELSSSGEL